MVKCEVHGLTEKIEDQFVTIKDELKSIRESQDILTSKTSECIQLRC